MYINTSLRANAHKIQSIHGQGQNFDFAHILPIDRHYQMNKRGVVCFSKDQFVENREKLLLLSATSKHPKFETKSAACKTLLACKRRGIWGKSFPVY